DGGCVLTVAAGDQRAAPRRLDEIEDRIAFVRVRLVAEIDAREGVGEEPAREDDQIQMRRLPGVAGAGDGTGLDRLEIELALRVRTRTAEAAEILVRALAAGIVGRMLITSGGVGLPDLQHRVFDRVARAVEHAAFETDVLAGRIGRDKNVAGQLALAENRLRQSDCEIGSDSLGRSLTCHWTIPLFGMLTSSFPWASPCGRAARCRSGSRWRCWAR